MPVQVCVIGGGINGFGSAVALQRSIPHAKVTIVAEKFSPHTTSNVAAGILMPYLVSPADEPLIKELFSDTFAFVSGLIGEGVGALWQTGYMFREKVDDPPFWADVVRHFRELSTEELRRQPIAYKQGFQYTTLGLEPTTFIAHLTNEFLSRGGTLMQRRLQDIKEVTGSYDVIVNCTGLGSRFLLADNTIYPIRGQIVRVKCSTLKYFFFDDDYYVVLNRDIVILGGTHDENEYDTTPSPTIADRLLKECTRRVPLLKEAEVIAHVAGLRPYRPKLRLEEEFIRRSVGGKQVLVVHNYGHGGSGISLFWGCASRVVQKVTAHLQTEKARI